VSSDPPYPTPDSAEAAADAREDDPWREMLEAMAEVTRFDPESRAELPIMTADELSVACRRARRHAGLSQRAWAAKAGVAASTVDRIESCAVDASIGTVTRLFGAVGLTVTLTGLEPTTFPFGVVEDLRDRGERRAPPHRVRDSGFGWWDPTYTRAFQRAQVGHQATLGFLIATARARRVTGR